MTATIAILVAVMLLIGLPRGDRDPMPPGGKPALRKYYRRNRLEFERTRNQRSRT